MTLSIDSYQWKKFGRVQLQPWINTLISINVTQFTIFSINWTHTSVNATFKHFTKTFPLNRIIGRFEGFSRWYAQISHAKMIEWPMTNEQVVFYFEDCKLKSWTFFFAILEYLFVCSVSNYRIYRWKQKNDRPKNRRYSNGYLVFVWLDEFQSFECVFFSHISFSHHSVIHYLVNSEWNLDIVLP